MAGSNAVRARLEAAGASFLANDSIAPYLEPGDLDAIEAEVAEQVGGVLRALVIDTANDHNTADTAGRVARMFCREVFAGRYQARPDVTAFPNVRQVDEMTTVGPIAIRSACSHHLVPIIGEAWVGVIPSGEVIGLSKFSRLAEWIMARPQIQEEAADQLADEIERAMPDALGVAVVIRAAHFCCGWRGVRDTGQRMVSSVTRGLFREDHKARGEFMTLIRGTGF